MNQSAGKIEETDSTGRLACLNRKSAWPQTTKVEKLSSLCFSGKLCHRWYTMHVCMCTIVSDMYACVCVRARVHKIYDGTWATHICLYILHTYICACVSLSLCVSLWLFARVLSCSSFYHALYPSFVFSSSSLRCRLVSCCTNPSLVRQLLWQFQIAFVLS